MSQKALETLEKATTKWSSIWMCFLFQTLIGIQFSIFITSMWPYLTVMEPNATLYFFGWVMAVFSLGQMISSTLFGHWNQKTLSTKNPVIFGFLFMVIGNLLYAFLPSIPKYRSWFMLVARLLVGLGSGNLCVLRGYCSMACSKEDLPRVMPLAVGSYVLGLSLGPAIQALFVPLGQGFIIESVVFSMYTSPAFLMGLCSFVAMIFVFIYFTEDYAGILESNEKKDPYVVLPKFDKAAAFTCIYLYFMFQAVTTSIEAISTPFTIALYNWTNKQAVFYGGILQFIGSSLDIVSYLFITFTRIGHIDKRIMLTASALGFIIYHLFLLPWHFYDGPLDYIKLAGNSTVENTSYSGGCFRSYEWCAHTTRVPLWIYIFGFTVVLAFAFPFTAAPLSITYSEVLGPRKQGTMQGIMEFFGSFARCTIPIIQAVLFEYSGYIWPIVMNLFITIIGLTFVVIFFHRIVPLKLVPQVGVPTPYKSGVFYRL